MITGFILDRFAPDGIVKVVGDETVDGHRGKKVYGKARHRDAVPCLFLLYSVVAVFYDTMPTSSRHLRERRWLGKEATTFSDMIISVRHHLWVEWIFTQVPGGQAVQKLSPPIRKLLDFGLTQAA